MLHLPQLIQDLGIILITAAVVTVLFKKLKQPVVLGYLIAGFLLGPHVPFMPTIEDTSSVKIWAEIGVIILLFGLGLEFNFKKLAKVGRAASIIAVIEVVFMILAGFFTGQLLEWTTTDSLFLGGILSISSTTIIVRAFDELGLKSRKFVSLVFGVLIVEDIVAILLLVLLSTVAISQTLSGSALIFSGLKLGFFLILWFALGIYLLPPFINRIRSLLSDETVLVVALGLCLLMVIIATEVGFSPALGAFVMGALLSETKEGERVEKLIHPVRDLFAAVFFVSVGMLIEPGILVEYRIQIVFIMLVTIVGKFLSSTLGALVSGASVRHSVQVGMSLAQIGEFSFIIATLGLSLKVTSEFLYPIAVAVSALTTFSTPYLIRASGPFSDWIEARIPHRATHLISRYQVAMQSEAVSTGVIKLIWRAFGWRILLNSIIIVALFLFAEQIGVNFVAGFIGSGFFSSFSVAVISLLFATPFLWAIAFGEPSLTLNETDQQRIDKLVFGVRLARSFVVLIFVALFINRLVSMNSFPGILLFLLYSIALAASRLSSGVYSRIESRFIKNLTSQKPGADLPQMSPWDVSLADFVIHPNSKLIGETLMEARLRENYGVTVTLVQRGDLDFIAPGRDWIIMPFDKLYVIGSDEQLAKLRLAIEQRETPANSSTDHQLFGLRSILLNEQNELVGKIIRECGIREAVNGMIVGIERESKRILSPDSAIELKVNDLLWIVGNIEKIKSMGRMP